MSEAETSPAADQVRPRQLHLDIRSDRLVCFGLLAVAGYALLRSIVSAATKPFWFDEVLTFVVSRQSNLSAILAALKQGVDGNPPGFYLAEHLAASVLPNEQIGYRLLSILGFMATLLLLFMFLRTRCGARIAFACSSLLLITPLFTQYAQEARPYSLIAALTMLAFVCYQRTPRVTATFGLGLSLVLAALLHYYTFLIVAPFFLAEFAFAYLAKRIRFGVWLALLAPLAPIALSWPRLVWMKQNWGPHFWAGAAALSDVSASYGNYFKIGGWGTALCALAICTVLAPLYREVSTSGTASQIKLGYFAERVLIACTIALPLLGFALAKFTHGPFLERYFLPSILGIVVAVADLVRLSSPRALAVFTAFIFVALASQEVGFWRLGNSRQTAANVISPVTDLANTPRYAELPIVVSDPLKYIEMWHYAPAAVFQRVFTFPEPAEAAEYLRSDTTDKIVLALRPYGPSGIQDFSKFAAAHPRFLLVSHSSRTNWLPARLAQDGYRFQFLHTGFHINTYLVEAPQQETAAKGVRMQGSRP
jgi:4-amino-4-deoxy-L-arabinose transferase-like glycosyltransferase